MKYLKSIFVLVTILLFFVTLSLYNQDQLSINNVDPDQIVANIAKILTRPKTTEPYLVNYPFTLLSPEITIAEGFDSYDGNLGDLPGDLHWGIDYVQNDNGKFLSFPVYSAHDGIAFQGFGKMWGSFVVIRKRDSFGKGFNTLYSHLENVPKNIPYMNSDFNSSKGIYVEAGEFIGYAGKTGNTKGINQLHLEFHIVDQNNKTTFRADPYGVYGRLSSGLYPQPGSSLSDLSHYWNGDMPNFAK